MIREAALDPPPRPARSRGRGGASLPGRGPGRRDAFRGRDRAQGPELGSVGTGGRGRHRPCHRPRRVRPPPATRIPRALPPLRRAPDHESRAVHGSRRPRRGRLPAHPEEGRGRRALALPSGARTLAPDRRRHAGQRVHGDGLLLRRPRPSGASLRGLHPGGRRADGRRPLLEGRGEPEREGGALRADRAVGPKGQLRPPPMEDVRALRCPLEDAPRPGGATDGGAMVHHEIAHDEPRAASHDRAVPRRDPHRPQGQPRGVHRPQSREALSGMRPRAATLALGLLVARVERPAHAQEREDRFQFGGWVRTSLEDGLSRAGYHPDAPDPLEIPRDQLVARQQLHLRERYARGKSFEVVVSGLLSHGLFESDASSSDPWLLVNGRQARTRFDSELREAWVGLYSKRIDFRVGNQRVAWGHVDAFTPNDVVNARDIRDPVLSETELRQQPTFMMRADASLGFGSLQVIAAPFFRADRYDVYGPNWAFLQIDAPRGYRGLMTGLTQGAGLSIEEAGRVLLSDRGAPADNLSGTEAGVRFDWRIGGVDISHYYHQGFHGTPDFQVAPSLGALLDATDWSAVTTEQARALLAGIDSTRPVTTRWRRRHHVGLGATTTTGRLVLRLDAAHEHPGLFYDLR